MSHLDYEINKELGECYLFMGDLDKAEEYYLKAAGSNGAHQDPYIGLATIAVQRGSMDDALALYRKAETIESSDKSLGGIGLGLMDKGDHEGAFTAFLRGLERNPQNLVLLNTAVQEAHCLGKLQEMVPYLEKALEVNPQLGAVRFTLAGSLVHLGSLEKAAQQLEILLASEPDNAEAKELYDAIKQA